MSTHTRRGFLASLAALVAAPLVRRDASVFTVADYTITGIDFNKRIIQYEPKRRSLVVEMNEDMVRRLYNDPYISKIIQRRYFGDGR